MLKLSAEGYQLPPEEVSVKISGNAKFGETLKAEATITGNMKVSYQWYAEGTPISGASNETYKITNSDNMGKTITVRIKIDGYGGYVESAPTSAVIKGDYVLTAPAVKSVTSTRITVLTQSNQQYAINTENTVPNTGWQTGGTFSGLTPNTTYYVFAKIPESDTYNEAISSSARSTTLGASSHSHLICGKENGSCSGHNSVAAHTNVLSFDSLNNRVRSSLSISSGDYYLESDLTIPSALQINGAVTICLNGHTLQLEDRVQDSVITINSGSFTLCDCNSGGLTHYLNKTNDAVGRDIWSLSASATDYPVSGGIITGGKGKKTTYTQWGMEHTVYSGGGIYANGENTSLTMYGGTVAGNSLETAEGTVINYPDTNGGGVYLNANTEFTMHGGSISFNNGGGIYVGENTSFTMNDGTISENYRGSDGGGIYSEGTITMNGGVISKNKARFNGGGVDSDGQFTMNGGKVCQNEGDGGAGIYAGNFTMTNGEVSNNIGVGVFCSSNTNVISGGVISNNTSHGIFLNRDLTITGVTISGNKGKGIQCNDDLRLAGSVNILDPIEVHSSYPLQINGDFQTDSPIILGLKANSTTPPITMVKAADDYKSGVLDTNDFQLFGSEEYIDIALSADGKIVATPIHTHPYCGEECAHSSSHSVKGYYPLPTGEARIAGGYYYLAEDVTLTEPINPDGDIFICLNGHTLKQEGEGAVITIDNSDIYLCDCQPDAPNDALIPDPAKNDGSTLDITGGLITGGTDSGIKYENDYGNLYIYGGTIAGNTTEENGGGICSQGNLNLYGGKIKGNTAKGNGGGIYSRKTLTVQGGTVANNLSKVNGGGIYYTSSESYSSSEINGGTIEGNTAKENGGGIYCAKELRLREGTVKGNTAGTDGGGVYYYTTSSGYDDTNTEGITIENNKAVRNGGGICYSASKESFTFTMYGTTVKGNTAGTDGGGVYYTPKDEYSSGGEVEIDRGSVISENKAGVNGGGAHAQSVDVTGNSAVKSNTAEGNGGGMYGRTVYARSNASIEDNTAKGNGGGVYGESNVSIYGLINNNTSKGSGGGVYSDWMLYMYDKANVTGNTAEGDGGGLYAKRNVSLSGGTVEGNTAKGNGGGVYQIGTELGLEGSPKVCGNKGGNIYLPDNTSIKLAAALTKPDTPSIGITMNTPGVFTSNWTTYMTTEEPSDYFFSDNSVYQVYKTNEEPSNAKLDVSSAPPVITIDYKTETLSTASVMEYSTDGGTAWTDCTDSMSASAFGWDGTADKSVKFCFKDKHTAVNSFTIPSRPAAPTGITAPEHGKISGLTTAMEYKKEADESWTECTGENLTGLSAGNYQVRYKATETAFASTPAAVEVTAKTLIKPNITTKNVAVTYNGAQIDLSTLDLFTIPDGAGNASYKLNVNQSSGSGTSDGILLMGRLLVLKAGEFSITVTTAANDNYSAGTATAVLTVNKASAPAAPAGLQAVNETFEGDSDGKITGVTEIMEYKLISDTDWTSCSGTEITGLASGEYEVRLKETDTVSAGISASVTIAAGPKRAYALTVTAPSFTAVNYGYTQPAAQAITIANTGNNNVTISNVEISDTDKFILDGSGTSVAVGNSINTWTVQPKANLEAGEYTTVITVTYDDEATAVASVTFTVSEADQSAPAKPELSAKTHNSVTLIAIDANTNGADVQYSKDNGTTWQDSPVFTGLTPETEYTFIAHYKEVSGKYNASDSSVGLTVTTSAMSSLALSVIAPIFTAVNYGYTQPAAQAITIVNTGNTDVTISNVEISDTDKFILDGSGTSVAVGNSINTWTVQPKANLEAGEYTTVITITYDGNTTASANVAFKVTEANQSAPIKPILSSKSHDSVTLKEISVNLNGAVAQYSMDNGTTWQDSPIFKRLTPETEYTFIARYKEVSGKYAASDASEGLTVATSAKKIGGGSGGGISVKSYKVTFKTGTNGKITDGSSSINVTSGSNPTSVPTVKAKEGFKFIGWSTDGKTVIDPMTVTIEKSVTFTALYEEQSAEPTPTPTPKPTENPGKDPVNKEDNPFTDIKETDWFYNDVVKSFKHGLMSGISETEFSPYQDITRGMFVAVLYRIEEEPETNFEHSFKDVSSDEYYSKAVAWASEHKIVEGFSDETYAPSNTITREQMAAIVYRYMKYKDFNMDVNMYMEYLDLENVSDYAVEAVQWAAEQGIMQGNDDNTFIPQKNTIRAEATAVFERIYAKLYELSKK